MAFGQLVVNHGDGAEHELLKSNSRRELASGDEGLVIVFITAEDTIVGAILEEQVVALCDAIEAGEEREVVVVIDDVLEVVVVE